MLLALEGVLEMLSDERDVTLLMLLPSGGEGGGGYGSQERASGGAACGPVAGGGFRRGIGRVRRGGIVRSFGGIW